MPGTCMSIFCQRLTSEGFSVLSVILAFTYVTFDIYTDVTIEIILCHPKFSYNNENNDNKITKV